MLLENGADPAAANKWGATPLDNAKFADHMSSIALLAPDKQTKRAAETKLTLERRLRPTDEERQAKLGKLAADALAHREANRGTLARRAHPTRTRRGAWWCVVVRGAWVHAEARRSRCSLRSLRVCAARREANLAERVEREAAALEAVQTERRQRAADRVIARALSPPRTSMPLTTSPSTFSPRSVSPSGDRYFHAAEVALSEEELLVLEAAIVEAREAGNSGLTGMPAERLRAAEWRLEHQCGRSARASGASASLTATPVSTNRHSHRSPQKESSVERTLRRKKLAKSRKV
jgi:hypothetical protein